MQIPFDSQYAKAVLSGLGRSRVNLRGEREFVHHVYAGTVPYVEKQARRARNKVARASRRMNRS